MLGRVSKCATLCVTLVATGSCKRGQVSDPFADDPTRQLIGMGHEYAAVELTQDDARELARSVEKRRLFGWQIAQKIFRPITIPGDQGQGAAQRMGLWQAWFDATEIQKMFEILYLALPPERRTTDSGGAEPERVSDALVDCVIKRYASPERLKQRHGAAFGNRILKRIAQLKQRPARSIHGVERGVTLFNLPLVRHYLANYGKVLRCTEESAAQFDAAYPESDGENFAACFFSEFPPGAVAIKALWAREDEQIPLYDTSAAGVRDALTGAATWTPTCADPPCQVDAADPALDDEMYSARVRFLDGQENAFRLTAMHIATKEARDWTWTSLWWSPKGGEDFGQDMPEWFGRYQERTVDGAILDVSVPQLRHYKMCNTVAFREEDRDLLARIPGFRVQKSDKSLEAALLSSFVHGHAKAPGEDDVFNTWCSNPFVEKDAGMADTNCIGCHQHAGPSSDMENTRAPRRKTFPADYAWSFEFHTDLIGSDIDNIKEKFSQSAAVDETSDQVACPAP